MLADHGLALTGPAARGRSHLDDCDAHGDDAGVESQAREDLPDGHGWAVVPGKVGDHPRAGLTGGPGPLPRQAMGCLGRIDTGHDRIRACHAKDAGFGAG